MVSIYLVSCSNLTKVGYVGNGPHWESFVDQAIVDKHISHAKHCNSKTLLKVQKCQYEKFTGSFSVTHEEYFFFFLKKKKKYDQTVNHRILNKIQKDMRERLTAPKQRPGTRPLWKKP